MPRQRTSFKRGFSKTGARSRATYSRSSAASRIQAQWRARRATRTSVKRVIRQQIPTDYYQTTYQMAPQSGNGGNTLVNAMTVPFTIANETGHRTGDKVFFKGLTIKWSIHNQRPYAAGNTPGKVRFGLIEARGTALENDLILYNPTNLASGVNDTDAIFNHAKVRVIFDRVVTMGDADSFNLQGYRDHLNVKTFTNCNSQRMFISNDVLSPTRATMKNWYTFAIASGFSAGQIRISCDQTFSYKDLA